MNPDICTDLVVSTLVAIVAAALVGRIIIKVNRVGTASMVAGIQAGCLISSIDTEVAHQLEDVPEDEHIEQDPACRVLGK